MNTLCPESVSPTRKKLIIRELVQGKEAATQLKLLLLKPLAAEGSLSAEELVANVLRSFMTETLSVLSSSSEPGGRGVSQNLLISGQNGSPAVRSEGSSESSKRSSPSPVTKSGRGCYKRRSYYRCTLKYDQGCHAIKQVQRTQENPDMYQITYIGIHTCKATPTALHLVKDSSTWDSFLMNSRSVSEVSNEQDYPIGSPSPTIKQEYHKEDTRSDVTDHKCDPSL